MDIKVLFYKNSDEEWYLDLPSWTGDPKDLQLIKGADTWLDLIGSGSSTIHMALSDQKFNGAEILKLLRIPDQNLGGGGVYYLASYKRQKVGLELWLCDVTRFIFHQLPQKIYFNVCSANQPNASNMKKAMAIDAAAVKECK